MKKSLTKEQELEVCRLWESKKVSLKDLASKYSTCTATITRCVRKYGIKPRHFKNHKFNENYFDKIDTEDKAYFLGFLYADGYNNTERYYLSITLKWSDREILEKFRKYLGADNEVRFKITGDYKKCLFIICGKHISKTLHDLGCPQKKSLILKFPTYDAVPKILLKHFVRGYFDGDGCFGEYASKNGYKKYCLHISSTKNFCESLKTLLLEELQIHSSVYVIKNKSNNGITSALCCGCKSSVYKFLSWIYDDAKVYLDRKYKKYKESVKNQAVTIEVV